MACNPKQQQALQPFLLSLPLLLCECFLVGLWMPICKEWYPVLKGKQAASPLGRPKYSHRWSWCEAPRLLLNAYLGGAFLCYVPPSTAGNQHFTN